MPRGHIELESDGAASDLSGRRFATGEIAGSDEHGDAICGQLLRDVLTHALVGSGDESDAVRGHKALPCSMGCGG